MKGLKALSETVFGSRVLAHGYQRERKKSGNVYCGVSLLDSLASLAQERLKKTTPAPKTVSPAFSGDFAMPKFEDLVY